MKFSPDLAFRVGESLARQGFCIFGAEELERLFAGISEGRSRLHFLEEFAAFCGASMETTPHFTSARFTKLARAAPPENPRG